VKIANDFPRRGYRVKIAKSNCAEGYYRRIKRNLPGTILPENDTPRFPQQLSRIEKKSDFDFARQ